MSTVVPDSTNAASMVAIKNTERLAEAERWYYNSLLLLLFAQIKIRNLSTKVEEVAAMARRNRHCSQAGCIFLIGSLFRIRQSSFSRFKGDVAARRTQHLSIPPI